MLDMCYLCRVKTFKLTLSDSATFRALELASGHGVPVESYLSSEMEDLLDTKLGTQKVQEPRAECQIPAANWLSFELGGTMPDTLQQILDVCKYVYRNTTIPQDDRHARSEFLEALSAVAKNTINSQTGRAGVSITTVRDKCTTDRRLGLPGVHIDTPTFVGWLCRPELLRDHLCRKFPKFVTEIRGQFDKLLPHRSAE
jgi:hypothetical protein